MTAIFIDANELISLLSRIPAWGRVRLERRRLAPFPDGAGVVLKDGVGVETMRELSKVLDAPLIPASEFYMRGWIYELNRVGVVVADPGDMTVELVILERL